MEKEKEEIVLYCRLAPRFWFYFHAYLYPRSTSFFRAGPQLRFPFA